MNEDTRNIAVAVAIGAAVLFWLYGCGDESSYYCVEWEAQGGCISYESD